MKVTQKEHPCNPVTITLETQEEVDQMAGIMRWDWNLREGDCDPLDGLFDDLRRRAGPTFPYWAIKARDRATILASPDLEV